MNQIRRLHIIGFFFTIITGTLLHFIHEWFGGNLTAVLGAVNESTWEHLKLLFWPMTAFTILEYFIYGEDIDGLLPVKTASILLGMLSITALFYTYTGILGFHVFLLDIVTFLAGVYIAYCFSFKQIQEPRRFWTLPFTKVAALLILLALVICFIVFTFRPPNIGLFANPETNPAAFYFTGAILP